MIFRDIKQNDDEWEKFRLGKVTGSKLGCVMANFGKAFGPPAHDYALKIALERITGYGDTDAYSNSHMDRGHEQEPLARALYEETYFCDVLNGGFFDLEDKGCSPDGLVGEHGLIEIKSVIAKVHHANVKRNDVDPAYKWQVAGNLMFSKRDWIDFVSYCQSYPAGKKLFAVRKHKKELRGKFRMLKKRLKEFDNLIATKTRDILK